MMRNFIFIFILCLMVLTFQVSAEEDNDYKIIGLENIKREYEAGTNPETINFVKGLELYTNEDVLVKEKLLVDYSGVDFNRVGIYDLHYYVLFLVDNYEIRKEVTTIKIKITDSLSPKIEGVKPIIVQVNSKEIDYLKNIKVSDNDLSSPLNISVLNHNVNLSKVGIYPISYVVSDRTGNKTTKTTFVSVVEKIKETKLYLTIDKTEFNIMINHHYPHIYYKEAISCFDGEEDISENVIIIDDGVDYTKLGKYQVSFFVSDRYGNIIQQDAVVNIVEDNEPPYFINLEDIYELTINTTNFFKGIEAYDDVCGDVTDRIEVELGKGFRFDIEGDYLVNYIVSDFNGNELIKEVTVRVIDNLPPEIKAPDTVYIKVKQPVDLAGKITVIDNVDGEINSYTLLDNEVNIAKVGTYFIDISAVDSKGNEAIKRITVYVYDDTIRPIYEHPVIIGSISGLIISSIVCYLTYRSLTKRIRKST